MVNNSRNRFLTTFDEALVRECYRREQSVVPQQALALSNSQLVLDLAPQIAQRMSRFAPDDNEFIRLAFTTLLGFEPNEAEHTASSRALLQWKQLQLTSDQARGNLIWTLINHNDFVTLR